MNDSNSVRLFQGRLSAPFCLNLLLLLPAALEELIYELTFLRQYDHNNLILG